MKRISQLSKLSILLSLGLFYFSAHAQINVTLGPGAGASITTGEFNTLIGHDAGTNILSVDDNTFIGTHAGINNLAAKNTFIGSRAGWTNSTGVLNVFIGSHTGYENTTGSRNTFLGTYAGNSNTTGSENTFVGLSAGVSNTEGSNNTFVGRLAGYSNEEGEYNTFLGMFAGRSSHANRNTFLGAESGANTRSGVYNTFVGSESGKTNVGGSSNTFVGREAGSNNLNGNFNTHLGYHAKGAANASNSSAIGYRALVATNNSMVLGSIAGVNKASSNTNVGIGTTVPSFRLHVGVNDAGKPGSSLWTIFSDARLKKDIRPYTEGMQVIQQINPIRYRYNGKANTPTDEEFVGIIAQDIQRIAPYMVGETVVGDSTGNQETYLNFDANAMIYMLINAAKELNSNLEDLYIHHEELVSDMRLMETELDSLRKELGIKNRSSSKKMQPLRGAKLFQNVPNPSNGSTRIAFNLPFDTQKAYLRVSTISGKPIKEFLIQQRGQHEVLFQAGEIPSGTYIYQLILDGEVVDSKKMMIRN